MSINEIFDKDNQNVKSNNRPKNWHNIQRNCQ
jgi:hypothetical protein